jgi:hypothetical protein
VPHYYVNENAQWNGDHEVHEISCREGASLKNRLHLGAFDSCHGAVAEAKKTYPSADGCAFCCPDCNTG